MIFIWAVQIALYLGIHGFSHPLLFVLRKQITNPFLSSKNALSSKSSVPGGRGSLTLTRCDVELFVVTYLSQKV